METTKQEAAQIAELNKMLSQGKMEDQPKTPEFIGGMVANLCYQDAAFAKAFHANPDATVRRLASDMGTALPTGLKIVVRENDETVWNLPAPSLAWLNKMQSSSMSDEQMEQVSGGEIWITPSVLGAMGKLPHQKGKKKKKKK